MFISTKRFLHKALKLVRSSFLQLPFILAKPAIATIKLYQRFFSPFFGANCKFYPSCSSYALESFQTFGIGVGSLLTLKRLCKCHPFNHGGIDLVPSKKTQVLRKESDK